MLAALPHVESSFAATAYSKVGAPGLWRFMPQTGRRFMRVEYCVDEQLDLLAPRRPQPSCCSTTTASSAVGRTLVITADKHDTGACGALASSWGRDDLAVIVRRYDSRGFGFASHHFQPSFLAALTIDRNPQRYFSDVRRAPELVFHEVSMPGYAEAATLEQALRIPRETLRDAPGPASCGGVG